MRYIVLVVLLLGASGGVMAQERVSSALAIARVKYAGGGDWYNDPTAEVNLLAFMQKEAGVETDPRYRFVELQDDKLFNYPFLFLTGHGNIVLSAAESQRLRTYLENGGFLYVDDDYGLDKAFRREMKKVFPAQELAELPFGHGLYHILFDFPNGPPKTHEHDKKPPQGFGLFHEGRLVVYYTFEANPSDGWADPEVHGDPVAKRIEALRFGTNIVLWALTQ